MIATLKYFLPEQTRCLLEFCLDYGTRSFSFTLTGDDPSKSTLLRERLAAIPNRLRRFTRWPGAAGVAAVRTTFWDLCPSAIDALLDYSPSFLVDPDFNWYFDGKVPLVVDDASKRINLSLCSNEWQELFRRGFEFSISDYEGKVETERFLASELPENQKVRQRSARTIEEVLQAPYALYSRPQIGLSRIDSLDAQNPHILAWWTSDHDRILKLQIERDGFKWWPNPVTLLDLIDSSVCLKWKREDPRLRIRNDDVLSGFARARAEVLGYTRHIAWPEHCQICDSGYSSENIIDAIKARLNPLPEGICGLCFEEAWYQIGNNNASKSEIVEFVRAICLVIDRVPTTRTLVDFKETIHLDPKRLREAIRILRKKPSPERVRALFGSWLAALIAAEVLDGSTKRTSRGTQCLAKDGHFCRSLAEKTIDDFLFERNISHEREVWYGADKYQADFAVGTILVEYFGLTGNPEYDAKTEQKLSYCRESGIELVALFPADLLDLNRLNSKFKPVLEST